MGKNPALFEYTLHLADNALILGQRLGEWCGHGPVLEQDIALTNIALDQIGQSRMLYQYAAEIKGDGSTEDSLAFVRLPHEYLNCLLVEQPNGNFGDTMMRQFLFDAYNFFNFKALENSKDETLAAIAARSIKEIAYHLRFSSEWVIRLGDGTEESHAKMQTALERLWMYTDELYQPHPREELLTDEGIIPDMTAAREDARKKTVSVLQQATLDIPEVPWMQTGGKSGKHTEHLGHLLTDLQYMQRAYPGLNW